MKVFQKDLKIINSDSYSIHHSTTDIIYSKIQELVELPPGIKELTIKISATESPVIDIKHLVVLPSGREIVNTILM